MWGLYDGCNNVTFGHSSSWVEFHETKNCSVDSYSWNNISENKIQNSGRSVYPSSWFESCDNRIDGENRLLNRSEALQKAIGAWTEPAMSLARSLWLTKDFADAWKKKIEQMKQDKKYQWLSSKWQEIQAFYETLEEFGYKNVIKSNTPISWEVWRYLLEYLKELWEQKNAWAEMAMFMDKFWDKRDELESCWDTFFGMKRVDSVIEIGQSDKSWPFIKGKDTGYGIG